MNAPPWVEFEFAKAAHTTPLDREILSHYYCGPTEFPRLDAPACEEAMRRFLDLGLIVELAEPNQYGARFAANRNALQVYMAALDAVPLPVSRWVLP